MELRNLIKSTSYLSGSRMIQFSLGIIKSKINAIFLGVHGIGIFSQLDFATRKMAAFTILDMSTGVVKQIAENNISRERFRGIKS